MYKTWTWSYSICLLLWNKSYSPRFYRWEDWNQRHWMSCPQHDTASNWLGPFNFGTAKEIFLATYFGKGIHSQGFWLCSHKVPAATTQLCPCSMRIAISNECGCVPIKLYLEKWWARFGLSITIWPENIVPCTREKLCGPEWRDVFLLTMWPSPCLVPGWA